MVGENGAGAECTFGECALDAAQEWTGWSALINGSNMSLLAGHDYNVAAAARRLDDGVTVA